MSPTPSTADQTGQVAKLAKPETLQAPPQDVELAKSAIPIEQKPNPAPQSEVDRLKSALNNIPGLTTAPATPTLAAEKSGAALTSSVLQWQADWVQYDAYYRPMIFNPYRGPLQVVYVVAGAPRIVVIPPLARIVTEVAAIGAYSFTAMVLNAVGIPTSVAVGSFLGGGYYPGPGLPPPPPPPPVVTATDVPVVVKYTNAVYQPFRVQKIVDVGDDPAVGERKVLLDGATPAWGQWKTTPTGERQFEVHKTQQFPGMDAPAEGPLPGDYELQLASAESSSGLSGKDIALITAAAVVVLLGLGAIAVPFVLGRRRAH